MDFFLEEGVVVRCGLCDGWLHDVVLAGWNWAGKGGRVWGGW